MVPNKKQRVCKVCRTTFDPSSIGQKVCSLDCAIQWSRDQKNRSLMRETKRRKQALKTKAELTREAQAAFNKYIRIRDEHKGCVSCGTRTAKQYHAGHYRTTKAAPQLRFNTYNVHKQCAQCNNFDSGRITDYRIELVKRIGADRLDWIECNQDRADFTPGYLRRLKKVFNARARHLERLRKRKKETLDSTLSLSNYLDKKRY